MNVKSENRCPPAFSRGVVAAGVLVMLCFLTAPLTAVQQEIKTPVTTSDTDPLGLRSVPPQAEGIGVNSREGTFIDGDITFYDSENRLVRFGDFFKDKKRPVMLSFNYSRCPKLCEVQLENITFAMREIDLEVGKDFDYISVSIDPKETSEIAKKTKELYTSYYNRPQSNAGWHFLVGKRQNIEKLAEECGFLYKYIPEQNEYSHVPALILISPEGEIVRYIAGLNYEPATIRLALIETADGKIGSPVDWAMYSLGCYSFDSAMGKYGFQAMALMRIGGLITIAAVLIGLIPYWFFRNYSADRPDEISAKNPPLPSGPSG